MFLPQQSEFLYRMERVSGSGSRRGSESSYGLELLASVHGLATHDEQCTSPDHVIEHVLAES